MRILVLFILVCFCCFSGNSQTRKKSARVRIKGISKKQNKNSAYDDLAKDYLRLYDPKVNDWIAITSYQKDTHYFNPSKVSKYEDLREFWLKEITLDTNDYFRRKFAALNAEFPEDKNFDDFGYALERYKVDCKQRQIKFLQEILYKKDGNTMGGVDVSNRNDVPWQSVVPDSNGEKWFNTACLVNK